MSARKFANSIGRTVARPSTEVRAERGELGLGREGLLRAVTGDGEGGIGGRFDERRIESEAAGEIAGEAADEGVAGARGVDGLNLDRRDALRAIPCRKQRAPRAKCH